MRKENGLTRNELSLVLDVPYSTLAEIENSNYSNPRQVIRKLADVFDVDEDLLLRDYNNCREEKRRDINVKRSGQKK